MKSLVGYTGFVGSNIAMHGDFDNYYDSKNIGEAFGTNPDLLVYAGVPAQKFIANKFPEQDVATINNAIENIKKINPKKIVLISTIDVYKNPNNVDENSKIILGENEPYGEDRHALETWVMNNIDDYLVVRLPGLYGKNIKKNFIYDLIHIIPSMLKSEKFNELCSKDDLINKYYEKQDNGFYKLKTITKKDENKLKKYFNDIGFSALNFTDSRGMFQFYNLAYLWDDINIALNNNIKLLNLATEPVSISELYKYVTGNDFVNEIATSIPSYNYKTIHSDLFNGKNGYIFDKEFILNDIKKYITSELEYQLSVSNIGWSKENDNVMLKYISKAGFKGLEIAPTRIISDDPYNHIDEAKEFSNSLKRKYGMAISSIQSIWYGKSQNMFESETDRQILIDYTKKAIDFASAIGCENLVFGCPKNRNIDVTKDIEDCQKIAIKFFEDIGKYASNKGVVIAIEANPKIYNTNFINTTEEALNIVKKINMDSIKVNVDLGTMIENNENINTLVGNLDYVNHIHISEPYLNKIENRSIHKDLKELLKKENYTNYVSIEMKDNGNINDVKDSVNYVKRLFK